MKIVKIREIAEERGIQPLPKEKTDLIHAIQQAEGNSQCYATGISESCGQDTCLWLKDCVKED